MAPLSPLDPRRIARSFSDVLLRFVVRPTRGVPEYGHDRLGAPRLRDDGRAPGRAAALVQLGTRFFSAVWELFRLRRDYLTDAAQRAARGARAQAWRRWPSARASASRSCAPWRRCRCRPVTQSIPKILASVLLDRLALGHGKRHGHPSRSSSSARATCGAGGDGRGGAARGSSRIATFGSARRSWFGEHLDNDAGADRARGPPGDAASRRRSSSWATRTSRRGPGRQARRRTSTSARGTRPSPSPTRPTPTAPRARTW